jgi:hypothetical protein
MQGRRGDTRGVGWVQAVAAGCGPRRWQLKVGSMGRAHGARARTCHCLAASTPAGPTQVQVHASGGGSLMLALPLTRCWPALRQGPRGRWLQTQGPQSQRAPLGHQPAVQGPAKTQGRQYGGRPPACPLPAWSPSRPSCLHQRQHHCWWRQRHQLPHLALQQRWGLDLDRSDELRPPRCGPGGLRRGPRLRWGPLHLGHHWEGTHDERRLWA